MMAAVMAATMADSLLSAALGAQLLSQSSSPQYPVSNVLGHSVALVQRAAESILAVTLSASSSVERIIQSAALGGDLLDLLDPGKGRSPLMSV